MYKSSAAFSFTKTKKVPASNMLDATAGKPGPGSYKTPYKSSIAYGFQKEPKLKLPKSITPGVGTYNVQTPRNGGPKYSVYNHEKKTDIGEMLEKKKVRQKTPGPGEYNSKLDIVKPRQVLGKFSQKKKDINYNNKVPGVGSYTPRTDKEFGKSTQNKFTMAKSQRSSIVDKSKYSSSAKNKGDIQALDPGKYTIKQDFGNGRKALLRGKPKEYPRSKTPGPGSYKPEDSKKRILKRSPTYSMGLGKKTDIVRKYNVGMPGPKYNPKTEFDVSDKKKINARTFGKEERMKLKRSMTPGPGRYKIPCSFGYTAPYSGLEHHYI